MSIRELQQSYLNTSYDDPVIVFEDSIGQAYLRFAHNISLETAKAFTNDLAKSNFPKILEFAINEQLSQADLDFFLARATHFFYIIDWPLLTGSWFNQWANEGKSYPLVSKIVFNNFRWAFTREQLPSLKTVFPNLVSVEYLNRDYDNEKDPLVSQDDLEAALAGINLMPYDN